MATLPDSPSGVLLPRRISPHLSVSLPGNKRQKLEHLQQNHRAASASLKPPRISQQHSQGSGSDQSATQWFDNINRHVNQSAQGTTACDGTAHCSSRQSRVANCTADEPPFFMANQRNDVRSQIPLSESSGFIFGGGPSRLDSENEDLRGVIDDLTVENKKLRQILRTNRSHRASPSIDSQDKLFEVRMHGLPAEKRRELEFLLKNFATSLHTSAPSLTHSNSGSAMSPTSLPGTKHKTDSGYASNSNSGQTSLSTTRPMVASSKRSRDNTIKNYLHDIPDTLLPRQNPVMMSERAKMALVVRRLEQLFTGKSAAPGEHSQPLQQQEVSQMAARADATSSRKRAAEGTREAHILPPDSKVNFDAIDMFPDRSGKAAQKPSASSDASATDAGAPVTSRPGSPDQRPTRPLDLDIHRAQVAEENIQYIRHLGLSSPRMEITAERKDGEWIYLNLLVNMAQLHTVNVTPAFVQRAIKKLSTKFELSKDGNRVRWIGGPDGTVFSKEEEKALESVDHVHTNSEDSTEDGATGGSSGKRSKTDSTSNAMVSTTPSEDKTSGLNTSSGSKQQISTGATSNLPSSNVTKSTPVGSAFDYKPLVYRARPRSEEEILFQDSDSSHDSLSRDSSSLVHALSRSNLNQRRSDEGLITFYNNPHFCSDYSGDKNPTNIKRNTVVEDTDVVGLATVDISESPLRYGDACYFTPQFAPAPYEPQEHEVIPTWNVPELSSSTDEERQPVELFCSGVGGIVPDDNFAVDVKVLMQELPAMQAGFIHSTNPLTRTKIGRKFSYRVIHQRKLSLLPPRLPPASYIFFTSSSSSGNPDLDESEDDSDETSSSAEDEHGPPPTFMRLLSGGSSGNILDEDLDDNDDDDDDDDSVDMLAMARAMDPATIAEQERQYMINEPGTHAVAGSLAATVGASVSSPSRHAEASDVDIASHMAVDEDAQDYEDDDDEDEGEEDEEDDEAMYD